MRIVSKISFFVLFVFLSKDADIVAMESLTGWKPVTGKIKLTDARDDLGYVRPRVEVFGKTVPQAVSQRFGLIPEIDFSATGVNSGHHHPANTVFVGVLIIQDSGYAQVRRVIPAQQLLFAPSNNEGLAKAKVNGSIITRGELVPNGAIDGYIGQNTFHDELEYKLKNFFANQAAILATHDRSFVLEHDLMLPDGQPGPNAVMSYSDLRRKTIEDSDVSGVKLVGKNDNIALAVLGRQTAPNYHQRRNNLARLNGSQPTK